MATTGRKTTDKKTGIKKAAKTSSKKRTKKSTLTSSSSKALPLKGKTKVSLKKPAKKTPAKIAEKKKSHVKSPSEILADAAVFGILEKKGKNIICLDLKNIPHAVCDFFIICEAESTRQVSAIADSVDFEVKKKTGENPFHSEGWENSLWVLLDYVKVVVHVFETETRRFYNLESLWADAKMKEYGTEYV